MAAKVNGATELWGELGFTFLGGLDYAVAQYDPRDLLRTARALKSAGRTGKPVGPAGRAVAELLRTLAHSPAALKVLNAYSGRAPQELRGLNVAVHVRVARELAGKRGAGKAAGFNVAKAWKIRAATVNMYSSRHGKRARTAIDRIVSTYQKRPGAMQTRGEILAMLDAAMRSRARLSHMQSRE